MDNVYHLYHTDGCHLCEQAAELLKASHIRFVMVDIFSDSDLLERYKVRIPVIANDKGQELSWPFDKQQLQQFTQE